MKNILLHTVRNGFLNKREEITQYWEIDGKFTECKHIGNWRVDFARNKVFKKLPLKDTKQQFDTLQHTLNFSETHPRLV